MFCDYYDKNKFNTSTRDNALYNIKQEKIKMSCPV